MSRDFETLVKAAAQFAQEPLLDAAFPVDGPHFGVEMEGEIRGLEPEERPANWLLDARRGRSGFRSVKLGDGVAGSSNAELEMVQIVEQARACTR